MTARRCFATGHQAPQRLVDLFLKDLDVDRAAVFQNPRNLVVTTPTE